MKKIRKYILAILLSGTIALLVPACGGGGGGSSGDGDADDNASGGNTTAENGFAPASIAGKTAILYDPSANPIQQKEEIKFGTNNTCTVYWSNWGGGTTLTGTYTYNKLSENAAEIYISAKVGSSSKNYRQMTYRLHLIFDNQKSASGTKGYTEKVVSDGDTIVDTSGTHNIYFYL